MLVAILLFQRVPLSLVHFMKHWMLAKILAVVDKMGCSLSAGILAIP